jgi:hypothetical protein
MAKTRTKAAKKGKVAKSSRKKARAVKPLAAAPTTKGIQAWQDDPMGLPGTINRPVPNLGQGALRFKIKGPAVAAGSYQIGTPQFRYWTAAEAVRRGADFWTSLGVTAWQSDVGSVLPIGLDEGNDLNAYYDRTELAFFHASVNGSIVYSGESPDVVCHELGHACLDAHRPELFEAHFIEVGAFHESFGDISAILSALQLPSVQSAALAKLKSGSASVVSRCAEQLGWAIRQTDPQAVDPDCLRNASNKFKYVDPNTLPDSAPANKLCAEVHSFSRVFTGAFYDSLCGMLTVQSSSPTAKHLLAATRDYAALILDATAAAPIRPNFFAQVAARMVDADTARFQGKYRKVLVKAFSDHQILAAHLTDSVGAAPKPLQRAAAAFALRANIHTDTHDVILPASQFGLPGGQLIVSAPVESPTPLTMGMAELRGSALRQGHIEESVTRFVSMLRAHNRIAVPGETKRSLTAGPHGKLKTHRLVKSARGYKLERQLFLCGCSRRPIA